MKSLARTSKLALLGLTGLLALPASAEPLGIYAGVQGGYSHTDTNDNVIEFESGDTYGIYGGYKFLDWLGVEGGYSRLGQFNVDTLDGENVSGGIPVEINSWHAALSLWGPIISPVNGFAKLGAHYSEAKLESNDSSGEDYRKTTTNIYYSVGLAVPIVEFLSVTLAYENYRNIELLTDSGDDDLGHAGVDAFSVGVLFNF